MAVAEPLKIQVRANNLLQGTPETYERDKEKRYILLLAPVKKKLEDDRPVFVAYVRSIESYAFIELKGEHQEGDVMAHHVATFHVAGIRHPLYRVSYKRSVCVSNMDMDVYHIGEGGSIAVLYKPSRLNVLVLKIQKNGSVVFTETITGYPKNLLRFVMINLAAAYKSTKMGYIFDCPDSPLNVIYV